MEIPYVSHYLGIVLGAIDKIFLYIFNGVTTIYPNASALMTFVVIWLIALLILTIVNQGIGISFWIALICGIAYIALHFFA